MKLEGHDDVGEKRKDNMRLVNWAMKTISAAQVKYWLSLEGGYIFYANIQQHTVYIATYVATLQEFPLILWYQPNQSSRQHIKTANKAFQHYILHH